MLTYILFYFYISTEESIWQAKQKTISCLVPYFFRSGSAVTHINQTGDHNCTAKSLTSLLCYFPKASHPKFIVTKAEMMCQHHISKAAKTAFKKNKNCKQLN